MQSQKKHRQKVGRDKARSGDGEVLGKGEEVTQRDPGFVSVM
jgi:hypothetical protein